MMLPNFKYHPNYLENEAFKKAEEGEEVTCMCCGKHPEYYYAAAMYAQEDVDCLCPNCIADGSAAAKFDGTFVADAEPIENGAEKTEELFKRTPGYMQWQGEYWLACCNDYCAFIGDVGIKELEELGIAQEVLDDYARQEDGFDIEDVRKRLYKVGDMAGYLFKCLHCGKYRIWVDAS